VVGREFTLEHHDDTAVDIEALVVVPAGFRITGTVTGQHDLARDPGFGRAADPEIGREMEVDEGRERPRGMICRKEPSSISGVRPQASTRVAR
jgi:hypothetical protein